MFLLPALARLNLAFRAAQRAWWRYGCQVMEAYTTSQWVGGRGCCFPFSRAFTSPNNGSSTVRRLLIWFVFHNGCYSLYLVAVFIAFCFVFFLFISWCAVVHGFHAELRFIRLF